MKSPADSTTTPEVKVQRNPAKCKSRGRCIYFDSTGQCIQCGLHRPPRYCEIR